MELNGSRQPGSGIMLIASISGLGSSVKLGEYYDSANTNGHGDKRGGQGNSSEGEAAKLLQSPPDFAIPQERRRFTLPSALRCDSTDLSDGIDGRDK